MKVMEISKVRDNLAATVKAARGGERIVLERHGKGYAALVPLEDLELLERFEDMVDVRAAAAAKRDAEINGTVSWADLKAELGL